MSGVKHDSGKLRLDLLPPDALALVADILTDGADEYGERNWEEGIERARLQASLERHLLKWKLGITHDARSKKLHMAHVACNALMMLALEARLNPVYGISEMIYVFSDVDNAVYKGEKNLEDSK